MRVLLVDDHTMFRQSLTAALSAEPDVRIVGEAADGRAAVHQARILRPEVILMDLHLPELDGIEATRAIVAEFPDICVIGLSMSEQREQAEAMRDAGAMDYVTKSLSLRELLVVMRGCYALRREDRPPTPP